MGNARKFLKYFLPVITLPILANYLSSMYAAALNAIGSAAIAARGTVATMNNIYAGALHLMAIAVLSVTALLAENGKIKAAKAVHLVSLIVYAVTLVLIAAVYIFMPQVWMSFMGVPDVVFNMGVGYARMFILPVLVVAIIAALPSQLSGKHSFILIMALGAGIIIFGSFIGIALVRIANFGILGIALTDGLSFAVSSVMPFLMVPVKRYANAFAPSIPE